MANAQHHRSRIQIGSPYPLGATPDGFGTNFAVFSANAERIELCLFDAAGRHELTRVVLPECTDEVWHGYLPDVQPGQLYGYRAYGPYQPEQGHRFNPHKLLLDPYAKRLHGQLRWTDALYGYRLGSTRGDLTFDRRDSAPAMPKGMVVDDSFNWGHDSPLHTPWNQTVFYEAHVKGLTMRSDAIPAHERGTFAALADPYVIDHLVKLGVTSLELLPVHAIAQDRRLIEKNLRNYWGYNTLSYFAPEQGYLSDGTLNEMRRAIRQLHLAGIEVILDVVYNHTCEESELGPTLSFRGLDNASYYRLLPDNLRHCINDTGCGNTVNMSHPRVIQMVMDSLRYWVQAFHVDGFRFDLGVTLGREATGFDPGCGFFDALRQDPVLSQTKLISEPWDIGPGGYQIGNHPAGFAEWNGRFRDDTRRFWKSESGSRGAIAARLLGSADLFGHHRRRPWASVNFITAHDGFPLQDLVSYNDKHNEANGEDNRDGGNDNESFNWGAEGPTDDAGIIATREKVKRAMLMTLFFSNGTPMMLGGDEFGRTQQGNNNAYCHDDELSWVDWTLADSKSGKSLTEFTARCIAARRERPTLHAAHFYTGDMEILPGLYDTSWFDESGTPMDQGKWDFSEGRLLALRRVARAEARRNIESEVSASLLLVNASSEDREFILPPPVLKWIVLIDGAESSDDPTVRKPQDNRITVASHCALLLVADHVEL
jgi:glycogen operon protein